jgi:myo-inositol 2-dehydrogenase / D-chiro-inositol 1-dehydrogenase
MNKNSGISRRDLLKTTAAASATLAVAGMNPNFAFAQGSDKLRVGVVGCGGRGTGAVEDCVMHSDNVELVAMADAFEDRLNKSRDLLKDKLGDRFKVSADSMFTGLDAYKKVLASDVDLVILATPPGFRPMHIAAAVDAGKHIFAEKPVATDPTGIRSVLDSAKKIKEKKLAFVTGTQRRHQTGYIETIKRIHDGAIGDLVGGQCYWNQGFLWSFPRKPEWSDTEWQMRNWYYFTWICGDHIVEQHVHNIDVMNWCFGAHPVSAYGMGGRQVRTDPLYGHIYDHFAIEYVYPNGARVTSMSRHWDHCDNRVSERVVGTKGSADPSGALTGLDGKRIYKYRENDDRDAVRAERKTAYQQEHVDLIKSIRAGEPLNECQQVAESTLTAIMGRMSAYTGKEVSWEQAMNSKLDLFPKDLRMDGKMSVPPVPMPGKDPLV